MSEKTQYDKNDKGKDRRKKMILIPLHALAFIGIAILIIALINAENKVMQITMIPTPAPIETLPEETVPLANGTATPAPTPVISVETASPVVTPMPTESAAATPTPSSTEAATPRPTNRPTPTRPPVTTPTPSQPPVTTPAPSQPPVTTPTPPVMTPTPPVTTPTPANTPEPTPEYTYSVSAKQGVAPAGYMIVTVVVDPAGDYTVTYDGKSMEFNGSKYYLTVQALGEGESYRSHVKVRKN